MFKQLYANVFGNHRYAFDAKSTYFNMVLDFADGTDFSDSLSDDLARYFPQKSFRVVSLNTETGLLEQEPSLDSTALCQAYQGIKICFSLLLDFSEAFDISLLDKYTKTIRDDVIVGREDKIVTICILPEDDKSCRVFFEAFNKCDMYDKANFVFFRKCENISKLSGDICGTMLLNCSMVQSDLSKKRIVETRSYIEQQIAMFPEVGRNKIKSCPCRPWSTVAVTYNDERMHFLRYYMYLLYVNVKKLNEVDFISFCETYYDDYIDQIDMFATSRLLDYAIRTIPKIQNIQDTESLTLRDYYNIAYGSVGGESVVELTLKANISRLPKPIPRMIKDASSALFEYAQNYDSEDLFSELDSLLERYVARAKANAAKLHEQWKASAKYPEITQIEYINSYINYDREWKKCDFWQSVREFIARNTEMFDDIKDGSKKMFDKLNAAKSELLYAEEIDIGTVAVPAYSAKMLIDACDNKELHAEIASSYENYIASVTTKKFLNTMPYSVDNLFKHYTGLWKEYMYEFSASSAFSIRINQLQGDYCWFYDAI